MKKYIGIFVITVLCVMMMTGCDSGSYIDDRDNLSTYLNDIYGAAAQNGSIYASDASTFENNMEGSKKTIDGIEVTTKDGKKFKEAALDLMDEQTDYYKDHWDKKDTDSIDTNMKSELEDEYQDCYDIYAEIEQNAAEEESDN